MNATRALLLVMACLVSPIALACSPQWTPLGESLNQLSPGEVVVRADAAVTHHIFSNEHRRGTLTLNVQRCLTGRPRNVTCPTRLAVTFDEYFDGFACQPAIFIFTPMEVPRLHYFLLRHGADGAWTVRRADRHLWRL